MTGLVPTVPTVDLTDINNKIIETDNKIIVENNKIYDTISIYWDKIYPIGSIYMSLNSTSPATLFGGTWEQLKDRFLLGAGNSYSVNATGGEKSHTLTVNEMPKHDHNVSKGVKHDTLVLMAATQNSYGSAGGGGSSGTWYWNYGVPAQGGNAAHNNMPPYLAVYIWKRTA